MNEAYPDTTRTHLTDPEHVSVSVDSTTQWLVEQSPFALEQALDRALERHDELLKRRAELTPQEAREMAAIQDTMLSLMRINQRLPQTED